MRPTLTAWRISLALLATATSAAAQTRIPDRPPADGPANGQANLQSGGTSPRAPRPAASAAVASGSSFPGIPPVTPRSTSAARGPLCTDFRVVETGGWAALGPVQFPGPRGPVQMVDGQTVTPGDYLDGMDLASVLQRDCRRSPPPPPGS